MSLQKESEWEEKIRVAARLRPSTEESAMEYADEAIKEVKKAIAHRENEIAEEVKKMKAISSEPEEGWTEEEQAIVDIHNEILDKVLQIIKH